MCEPSLLARAALVSVCVGFDHDRSFFDCSRRAVSLGFWARLGVMVVVYDLW